MKFMEFFQEIGGQLSSTRLMSVLCVVVGLGLGIYSVIAGKLDDSAMWFLLGLIGLGITGKVVSKPLEQKPVIPSEEYFDV